MESLGISTQTLDQFVKNPFRTKNTQKQLKYEDRYQKFSKSNKIKIESTLEMEKNYFIHLKVPSESQKGRLHYDVVVQFFTPNKRVENELTVKHYYVQFFSNSPGFIYKYASLYHLQGYLIETLADKCQPGILDILPDKANSSYELYYDSSIYYACRYLQDHKIEILSKLNLKIHNSKTPVQFFDSIQDTESIGISRDVNNIEMRLKEEIRNDTKLSASQEQKLIKKSPLASRQIFFIKTKTHSRKTTVKGSTGPSKITAKKSTAKSTGNGRSIKRIKATKGTKRR